MPSVTNCHRKNIRIESMLNAPNPVNLVKLNCKNRELGGPGHPIVFNESENRRNSFPLKLALENQSEKSSREKNRLIELFPMLRSELFPMLRSGPHVKLKRLSKSLVRRSLIKNMERSPFTRIFHPDAASTPIQGLTSTIVMNSGSDVDYNANENNRKISSDQSSPLRQAHSNRVENSNRSAGNLREKSHFDAAIVEISNQHQVESHHMEHSSLQAMGNESISDSNNSDSSSANIEKINEFLNKLNNDFDSFQRHSSSETLAEQHQLSQLVEKLTNTVSSSDEFNESVFEGVTGREGRPNDIVFDLSPHRGKLWIDLVLRKKTTGANQKETRGASRSLFNRKREKRVVSEIEKSNRRNSNRNSKRKLYSHVGAAIENDTENRSENQSLMSEQRHTNCKQFGFFQPIVLGAAPQALHPRNLEHGKTTRIETTQKLFDFWRAESEKHQRDQQPKESLENEEDEPIFKVPEPPTRRKPIRTKLPAKNADESSSLTSGTAAQTSTSKKISRVTDRSNKMFESKANQQCNASFTNFRNDGDSFTTETSIQNGYRKSSSSTDRSKTNTQSESESLQRQRSKSSTRVSFINVSEDDQIDSVLAGTPLATVIQQQPNNTVNSELQSNQSSEMRRRKAYNEITGIELIEEIPSMIVPPPSRKRGRSTMKAAEGTLPALTTINSPQTDELRRSARKHHAPRPYWTSERDCYPIVEVNYKEPDIKQSRKRKTIQQPYKMTKKKKLEMICETVAGANDLKSLKKIANDQFDALKELSQTDDPLINTIRSDSFATDSVSREDSPKSATERPRKEAAVVAMSTTSTTMVDSGIHGSDREEANPQVNTTAANNSLFSWLHNLMEARTISSQPNLHVLAGVTIVSSLHLTFNSVDGVDYAYYDGNFPNSQQYGYMRFNPNTTKPITRTEKFELRFLSIVGELNLTTGENSVQLTGGAFITIPKGVKYSLANCSENTALIFFINT